MAQSDIHSYSHPKMHLRKLRSCCVIVISSSTVMMFNSIYLYPSAFRSTIPFYPNRQNSQHLRLITNIVNNGDSIVSSVLCVMALWRGERNRLNDTFSIRRVVSFFRFIAPSLLYKETPINVIYSVQKKILQYIVWVYWSFYLRQNCSPTKFELVFLLCIKNSCFPVIFSLRKSKLMYIISICNAYRFCDSMLQTKSPLESIRIYLLNK